MGYSPKNYIKDNGDTTVIGGEIIINGTLSVGASATVPVITTAATASVLGGIKAATKGAGDTVECKIDGTSKKLYVPTYPVLPTAATTATEGIVKQSANVAAAAGAAPTKEEFDALITALIAAGIMAAGA